MANKSKKRIKHEQHVRMMALEREVRLLRAEARMNEPVVLKVSKLITPDLRDAVYYDEILKMTYEEVARAMAEQILKSNVIEIKETREFDFWRGRIDRYDFTLRVLKRR